MLETRLSTDPGTDVHLLSDHGQAYFRSRSWWFSFFNCFQTVKFLKGLKESSRHTVLQSPEDALAVDLGPHALEYSHSSGSWHSRWGWCHPRLTDEPHLQPSAFNHLAESLALRFWWSPPVPSNTDTFPPPCLCLCQRPGNMEERSQPPAMGRWGLREKPCLNLAICPESRRRWGGLQ